MGAAAVPLTEIADTEWMVGVAVPLAGAAEAEWVVGGVGGAAVHAAAPQTGMPEGEWVGVEEREGWGAQRGVGVGLGGHGWGVRRGAQGGVGVQVPVEGR